MSVKNTNIQRDSEPRSRTVKITSSTSVETGQPPSTSTILPGHDTDCHPQSSTLQPTPEQVAYDPMPNASAGSTDEPPLPAPELRSRATPRRSELWSPSAGQKDTASETIAQSSSPAPLPPIARRTRKRQLPVGAYAEVNSDSEPNNGDVSEQDNEEYAEAQVDTEGHQPTSRNHNNTPDQRGQPRHKRRKTNSSQKPAATRVLRTQQTSSPSSSGTARRSNRITEQLGANLSMSSSQSQVSSDGTTGPEYVALYDEWPLPNAVIKRVIDGCVIRFQLEWEQPSTEQQPLFHSSSSQNPRSSPQRPISTGQSSKRRRPFSADENKLLAQLKGQCPSWKEIHKSFSASFPGRSLGTLQVHFSTRLKKNSHAGNV